MRAAWAACVAPWTHPKPRCERTNHNARAIERGRRVSRQPACEPARRFDGSSARALRRRCDPQPVAQPQSGWVAARPAGPIAATRRARRQRSVVVRRRVSVRARGCSRVSGVSSVSPPRALRRLYASEITADGSLALREATSAEPGAATTDSPRGRRHPPDLRFAPSAAADSLPLTQGPRPRRAMAALDPLLAVNAPTLPPQLTARPLYAKPAAPPLLPVQPVPSQSLGASVPVPPSAPTSQAPTSAPASTGVSSRRQINSCQECRACGPPCRSC